MTQEAVVTKLYANGTAEVAVTRQTACGANCGSCESCIYDNEVKALANNLIAAKPGQKVFIETTSKKIVKAVALVYVMPLILFLIGYAVAALLGASEGICILVSFLMLAVGGAIIVATENSRKMKDPITFDIIQLA